MEESFVKKYWDEQDMLFYLHFIGEEAVRQIQKSGDSVIYLSTEQPEQGEFFLYDQSLFDLDIEDEELISKEEFEAEWNKQ